MTVVVRRLGYDTKVQDATALGRLRVGGANAKSQRGPCNHGTTKNASHDSLARCYITVGSSRLRLPIGENDLRSFYSRSDPTTDHLEFTELTAHPIAAAARMPRRLLARAPSRTTCAPPRCSAAGRRPCS